MYSAFDEMIGRNVFVRVFPYHYIGRLKAVHLRELVLEDASWIADSGRWADALRTGTLEEVEPYPDGPVIVTRGPGMDVCEWQHDLPREKK